MAAPAEVTIKTLDGKWQINKSLSDSTDPVLALQGIGWLTRKAISLATVTQHLRSWTAPPDGFPTSDPITHIEINQFATGGLKGTTENRNLDYQFRPHSDYLFGDLQGRSRWTTLKELEGEYKEGVKAEDVGFLVKVGEWREETVEGDVVESFVESDKNGWTAWQVWGFADVKGERRLIRRFVVRKGDEVERMRLVYDWAGKLEEKK